MKPAMQLASDVSPMGFPYADLNFTVSKRLKLKLSELQHVLLNFKTGFRLIMYSPLSAATFTPFLWAVFQFLLDDEIRCQNPGYNYGTMGLSVTCDFEWSLCGWTQDGPSGDQLDWRRHRGAGGVGGYQIKGDHTPGKDSYGFYLYIDTADIRQAPLLPMDPDLIDSIEHPEPDELLAHRMGIASSSHSRTPVSGRLHDSPKSNVTQNVTGEAQDGRANETITNTAVNDARPPALPIHDALSSAMSRAYAGHQRNAYGNSAYGTILSQYGANTGYRSSSQGGYGKPNPYGIISNTDTNSDTKPYDLPQNRQASRISPTDLASNPESPLPSLAGPNVGPDQHPMAQLIGPKVESPIDLTLKFWFHMRGNDVGRLTLYRKVLARPDQIIWEKTGHQSFGWTEAQVQLERGSFQLVFEGGVNSRANPDNGYIGIDDITLDREADLPLLNSPTPPWMAAPHFQSHSSFNHPGSRVQIIENYNGHIPIATTTTDFPRPVTLLITIPPTTSTRATTSETTSTTSTRPTTEVLEAAPKARGKSVSRTNATEFQIEDQASVHNELAPVLPDSFLPPLKGSSTPFVKRRHTLRPEEFAFKLPKPSSTGSRKMPDLDLFPLESTELSAVRQEEEPFDKNKLILVIACCFGVAGLVVCLVFIVKKTSGFYDIIPCPWRHAGALAEPRLSASRSTHRPRHPPPPPPPPPVRRH